MPVFTFRAVAADGAARTGEIESPDRTAAAARLQAQGLFPVRIEAASPAAAGAAVAARPAPRRRRLLFARRRVGDEHLTSFTRELATLLNAGVALDRALDIQESVTEDGRMVELISRLREDVRAGQSLSAAMERSGGTFSRFYVSMVRAGEAGGALAVVLARIAEFQERSRDLRETVKSALIYPVILVVVAVIAVFVLLVVVVPQFSRMFAESGQALPLATQIVIGAGDLLRGYWWVLVAAALVAPRAWSWYVSAPPRRLAWDRRVLRMPYVGDLVAKVETARFARTLSTLLRNGVPLLQGLNVVAGVVANLAISSAVLATRERLKEGKGLGRPMLDQRVFPQLAVHMVMVGEETGSLDAMLAKVADVYDREVQFAVKRLLALVEPVMILGLGLVIGGIILSILLAILRINSLVA